MSFCVQRISGCEVELEMACYRPCTRGVLQFIATRFKVIPAPETRVDASMRMKEDKTFDE